MLSRGEYFSFGFQPSLCSRLFRRELLRKHQMRVDNSIRLGEDAACSYACILEAESIYYLKAGFFIFTGCGRVPFPMPSLKHIIRMKF